jgi:hypothetical protein
MKQRLYGLLYRASRITIKIKNLHFSMDLFTAIRLVRNVAKMVTVAANKAVGGWEL